ncbi:carboxymuconolactone decarboxylase family protein [Spiroplasma culicicola]|uniref:4-carboxymuconolactone decarboxylase n=1 Tax=Spiroplasma culicicola AES-1 TaxID=1276246 RepID=W6A8P2_9MOLU|nr:carboxymuconolactone decarboxylase family protein [Spiroplasma culicicola]AHI53336.1 4-carboxymuconolactone decarboxylase [Spiroplasma culicicola AES-1]
MSEHTHVKDLLSRSQKGEAELRKSHPEIMRLRRELSVAVNGDGVVSAKVKELISIGIAIFSRCEFCIAYHVKTSFQKGVTKDELIESAFVATQFGGGPSMSYLSATLLECIKEVYGE